MCQAFSNASVYAKQKINLTWPKYSIFILYYIYTQDHSDIANMYIYIIYIIYIYIYIYILYIIYYIYIYKTKNKELTIHNKCAVLK